MPIESPDIETFKKNLDATIEAVKKHKTDSHSAIKIQSLLNVIVYVMATRFLEGSIKHIVLNCCKIRGHNSTEITNTENNLKKFNNPEFANIQKLFIKELNYDIIKDINIEYKQSDITFLNQIVQNRHRNVHASIDSSEWYNQNKKDIFNFLQEYMGMINIVEYLTTLEFQQGNKTVIKKNTSNQKNVLKIEKSVDTKTNILTKLKGLFK